MKKIFLIIVCSIYSQNDILAQDIVNGNFSINNGNDGVACGLYGTFSDNSVPNWVRSHGTPNFQVVGSGTNNNMFLFTDGSGSEGILGGYVFRKTRSYCIKVNLA